MAEVYNHKVVEKKWQKVWDDEKAFAATNDYSKPKYYALVEFPYPSGFVGVPQYPHMTESSGISLPHFLQYMISPLF
jgi:hypothetical protein